MITAQQATQLMKKHRVLDQCEEISKDIEHAAVNGGCYIQVQVPNILCDAIAQELVDKQFTVHINKPVDLTRKAYIDISWPQPLTVPAPDTGS